jgi:hypothetical protein
MTSWTNSELRELISVRNHKVSPDIAGEFRWYHKLNGKWEIHSIQVFEDENKPLSWMYHWIAKWGEELEQREVKANRSIQRKLRAIRKSVRKTNKVKALEIRTLMTNYTVQEIANELSVSLSTAKRYLK